MKLFGSESSVHRSSRKQRKGADKGYGFITPDEGGEDLFVHHTSIAGNGFKSLDEGAKVSYEATQGQKGMQADNVSAV